MAVLRRELDLLEERLSQRIIRAEKNSDQFRALAIAQLDERLGDISVWRSAQEREVSQLSGTLTGVREELQNLFQRTCQNSMPSPSQQQMQQLRSDDITSALKVRLGVFECELQDARTRIEEQGRRLDMTESNIDVLLDNHSGQTTDVKSNLGWKFDSTSRVMDKLTSLSQKVDAQEIKMQTMCAEAERLAQFVQLQESRLSKFVNQSPASIATFGTGQGSSLLASNPGFGATDSASSDTPHVFRSFSVEKLRGKFEADSRSVKSQASAERIAQQNGGLAGQAYPGQTVHQPGKGEGLQVPTSGSAASTFSKAR